MSFIGKFQTPVFNICVGIAECDDLFDLTNIEKVRHILSTKYFFARNPIVIEADPFLFVREDTLYLFYEEQTRYPGKGVLKMTSTKDLKNWTKDIIVLKEPFHLSYPFVFEYNGKTYLMPETGHNRDIRLYEMSDDMSSCRYVKTLLAGENYVDSCIFRHDGVNYLFTAVKNGPDYEARIYIGDNNLDNWQLHPASPISTDNKDARCGGSIITTNGSNYRIAQDCSGLYGGGLGANLIECLTPAAYRESKCRSLFPNKKYRHGGHQYSSVIFKGERVVAFDYLTKNIYLRDIADRIKSRLPFHKRKNGE